MPTTPDHKGRTLKSVIPAVPGWFVQINTNPKLPVTRHGEGGFTFGYLPVIAFALADFNETGDRGDTLTFRALSPMVSGHDGIIDFAEDEEGYHFLEFFSQLPEGGFNGLRKHSNPDSPYWVRETDWVRHGE